MDITDQATGSLERPASSRSTLSPLSTSPWSLSAVSWGAVNAGAVTAAAASLVLWALGTGLGLTLVSPWPDRGTHIETLGIASIVWVVALQVLVSALGGYLAGRMRTRTTTTTANEVYFQDTAHGLLSWAVANLVTAALIVMVGLTAASTAVQATATVAGSATQAGVSAMTTPSRTSNTALSGPTADTGGPLAYLVDSIFRRDGSANPPAGADVDGTRAVAETTRIFLNSINSPTLPEQDVRYLGTLVAQRTGLAQADAERRVSNAFTGFQTTLSNAKTAAAQAAEAARKVSIQVALWTFIALLAGAFAASFTAMLGGRHRDA